MAFVKTVVKDHRELRSLHPTQLVCRYVVGERDGKKVIQLNSYGSDQREELDKLSQTLQFDAQSAAELFTVLKSEFGFT